MNNRFSETVGSILVIFSCALTAFVSMGIAFSFGTVYLDVLEVFQTTRPLAALVTSLGPGIGFGAGMLLFAISIIHS